MTETIYIITIISVCLLKHEDKTLLLKIPHTGLGEITLVLTEKLFLNDSIRSLRRLCKLPRKKVINNPTYL